NPNVTYKTSEIYDSQMTDRFKSLVSYKAENDLNQTPTTALNRNQGWMLPADDTKRAQELTIQDFKKLCYSEYIRTLVPLLDGKEFSLVLAGERKKKERATYEIKVAARDRPEVSLFFDKATGLLY